MRSAAVTAVTGQEPQTTPKAPDAAIRTEELRKTYKSNRGDVEAVRGIDLNVPYGEFFGLLGPNGGGKGSTGVVTQKNTLDMQLTVAENLEFRSRFFGLSARAASRRAAQLIDAFGLGDRRDAMSTGLSGGQARRRLIARAL